MSFAIKGLKIHRQYEDLIGVAVSDKLYNIKFPNRNATFLRNGFVLSQLDGEGMRAMQLQEEQAMKESLKDHLLKQTSQETGVNISDLRIPSEAKKRNIRINNMLRTTGTGDNDVNGRPTADSGFGNNDVNGIPTADSGFGNNDVNGRPTADSGFGEGNVKGRPTADSGIGEGNVNTTQYFNISDGVDTSAATADYAARIARLEHATQEEKRQMEQRYEQMAEGIRQEAFAALTQQEQSRLQQQEQDRALAEAAVNQIHREAQGVVNETRGAQNRERQERKRMEDAENRSRQAEQKTERKVKKEENRRRNEHTQDSANPKKKKTDDTAKVLGSLPPAPTKATASGRQETPESTHEARGKPGRPPNTQPKPKPTNQGPPIKTDSTNKSKAKANPKHDTEKDMSRSRTHWRKANRGYLVDQLSKHGWKWPKTSDGKNEKLLKP